MFNYLKKCSKRPMYMFSFHNVQHLLVLYVLLSLIGNIVKLTVTIACILISLEANTRCILYNSTLLVTIHNSTCNENIITYLDNTIRWYQKCKKQL